MRGGVNGVLNPGPGKAAVGRPAVYAVGAGIKDVRPLKAKAVREAVVAVDVIVDLGVKGVGLLYAHPREDKIGLSKCGPRNIRSWKEAKQLSGNRAYAVRADYV